MTFGCLSEGPGERGRDVYWAIGRLRPGVTVEQAVTQLDAVSRRLSVAHPGTNQGLRAVVVPLHEWQARDVKRTLLFALASALLVLTIAIANVAGLMLGRGDDRRGEFGVRVSLGASRSDLITQLLTESIVLAGVGGVLGVGLAFMLTNRLGILFVGSGSFAGDVVMDARALGFSLAVCVVSALLMGTGPALHATRDAYRRVSERGRNSTASLRQTRTRSLLVVAELAVSVVLLTAAAHLTRSLWQLTRVDPGIDTDVLTFRLRPAGSPEGAQAFYAEIYRRLADLPGVEGVASVNYSTLTGRAIEDRFGRPDDPTSDHKGVVWLVSPGYLEVVGMPLIRGRAFDSRDVEDSRNVVLVNRTLADALWPGEVAVGKALTRPGRPDPLES